MSIQEPSVAGGSRTTLDVLQEGRKPEKDRDIYDLEPSATPLLRFSSRLNKRVAIQPSFNWFSDVPMPWWARADTGALAADEDVDLVAGHGAYVPPGTLVYIPATEEYMRARSGAGDTITFERGVAGSTPVDIAAGADLRLIGDAFAEGSDAAPERATIKEELFNFTQIFKTAAGASGTQEQSEMWWGNDRARERKTRAVDHSIKIESAFLFGERAEYPDPDTGKPVRMTRGVTKWITTNVTAVNGILDEDTLEEFLEAVFRYSGKGAVESQTKWLFVSRMIATQINRFARERLETVPKEKTMGVSVTEYVTSLGTVNIIPHALLENNGQAAATPDPAWEGTAIAMDPESPIYRFMRNRDTKMMRGIELPGSDTWKDQFQSEVGLQFVREEANGMMTGITRA